MNKLPKRDEEQYTDIEKFRDFELTNCITYEMAIRNDDAIKVLKEFLEKFINEDLYEISVITDTSCFKKSQDKVQCLMRIHCINPLELYLEYNFLRDVDNKIKEILKTLKSHHDQDGINEDGTPCKEYLDLKQLFFEKGDFKYESNKTPEDDKKTAKLMGREVPKENNYTYYKVTSLYESFVGYKEMKAKDSKDYLSPSELENIDENETLKVLENNWIKPRYNRPELQKSFMHSYKRNVEIDFSLPSKELTDFIERLKQEHSSKESHMTKTPSELLGEHVEEYNLPEGFPKNTDKGFTIQDKWADWFFIYDYFKMAKLQNSHKSDKQVYDEIEKELKDYHDPDDLLKYWKKNDVYRTKVLPPMRKLIDELEYKKIISNL